jgi:phosphohistidine swiveling domain-containing protein
VSDDRALFPILRGISVADSGEFSGHVVIVRAPEDLDREWESDSIAVLLEDLEQYFSENPKALEELFSKVSAVIAEFGESISQLATYATQHDALAIVKVTDATYVLETDMHIRVEAIENQGDVFFID